MSSTRYGIGLIGNNRIDDYLYLTTFSNNGNYFYGLNNQGDHLLLFHSACEPAAQMGIDPEQQLVSTLTLFNRRVDLES